MGLRISVDTGGTFTDVVAGGDGREVIGKAPTTPERIFVGMRGALEDAAQQLDLSLPALLGETDLLIYGTTRATNAIVQGAVAKTAFLVTAGFPDILVLKEGGKHGVHDFETDYPDPYIPQAHTFEIDERIDAEGGVVTPLDREQARAVLQLVGERGFEALAVCLLWAVANPAHEQALAALIEEELPGVPYTLSHRLIPIVREYRRASATAIDASLKPLMQAHLRGMEDDLREAGCKGEILVSTSVGGCMHVDELVARPIHTVKSGPAMAPVAALTYSQMEGFGDDVIVCDTGGTTFDVSLVRDGAVKQTRETWIGGQWIGHILSISSVDVRSIGAGGGSVAWIDPGGLLRVGPRSAGAVPGPACYGAGGTEPTVTDAALLLGYLDPDYFLGGRLALDESAARRAVGSLADQLGKSLDDGAHAIMSLANELMIKAIQDITVTEGFNPRECTLVAGGGAAGLGAMAIAGELGCERVILPRTAAVLSACGMQVSDVVHEHSASMVTRSVGFDFEGGERRARGRRRGVGALRSHARRAWAPVHADRALCRGPLPLPGVGAGRGASRGALRERARRCRAGRALPRHPRAGVRSARPREHPRMPELEGAALRRPRRGAPAVCRRGRRRSAGAGQPPARLFRWRRAGGDAHLSRPQSPPRRTDRGPSDRRGADHHHRGRPRHAHPPQRRRQLHPGGLLR